MPFVEGESLADALRRRGPLTPDDAVRVAEPVLQALAHAHAQGLVHGDIKPDNAMLEAKIGRALLEGFGISKLLVPGTGDLNRASGVTVGHLHCIRAEQV